MNLVYRLVIAFSLLVLTSCGGSSSSEAITITVDYNGTWSVRYNALEALTEMTCGNLFGDDSFAFIDNHIISQIGSDVSLRAESGVIIGTGTVSNNNELMATEILSGDLFGDGRSCILTLTVTYQNSTENDADTLFLQSLSCDGELICEDQAFGSATR